MLQKEHFLKWTKKSYSAKAAAEAQSWDRVS
jgi:hypothetical protein